MGIPLFLLGVFFIAYPFASTPIELLLDANLFKLCCSMMVGLTLLLWSLSEMRRTVPRDETASASPALPQDEW